MHSSRLETTNLAQYTSCISYIFRNSLTRYICFTTTVIYINDSQTYGISIGEMDNSTKVPFSCSCTFQRKFNRSCFT